MVSLDEILAFMQQDREDRARQREQDKEERAKLREHDMNMIKEMIIKGVSNEVLSAIAPLKERQEKVEEEQQILHAKLRDILEKITENKLPTDSPDLKEADRREENTDSKSGDSIDLLDEDSSLCDNDRRQCIADLGRRTIGLKPFRQKDFDAEIRWGAVDENEAKVRAVKTFLRYEMNIKENIQDALTIERIFPPDKEDWSVLYVTFQTAEQANTVYSYARNMRKEVHIGPYIPKEWYSRYRALEASAYKLRHSDRKFRTRVKWGTTDLYLYVKEPVDTKWYRRQHPTDLPPVDLKAQGRFKVSPAPGRPGSDPSSNVLKSPVRSMGSQC